MPRWIEEVEHLARARLPEPVYRYFVQGAGDGVTAREARDAWQRLRLAPRVLAGASTVDPAVEVLGRRLRIPVAVAPTTLQRLAHPEGELAVARATAQAGSLMVVSSNAGTRYADIAATGVAWWVQAYLTQDRERCLPMLERAIAAGAEAVVLTVDTPVVARKDDPPGARVWDLAAPGMLRANFDPGELDGDGADKALDLGPDDITWLRERTGLPVVAKGVLRGDDARRATSAGAAAVWVSNHGGRQLDGAVSTAEALGRVVEGVPNDTEVYVDGGLRGPRDVVAAAALGARAVFWGRPVLFALAAEGPPGVSRLFAETGDALVETLRLCGCRGMGDTSGCLP